tara:strand:- start:4089 stop:4403 length:315 start_codon:yes stop_codon:yes gene_type:complete
MREETQAEKEEREFEEYTAKYCTPSVCAECSMCKHCEECECLPPMSEEKRKELIGLLSKIKDNMPSREEAPEYYLPLDDELEAEIEKAAKKLYERLYPNGDDVQ